MILTNRQLVARSILLLSLGLLFGQQKTSSSAQEITETTNSEDNLKLENIISNIQKRQFAVADNRILEFGVLPEKIAIIVNASTNVDFAIDYIRGTSKISINAAFADALCNHMESTGRLDVYELMSLDNALSRNMNSNQQNTTEGIRSKAKSTIDRIRNLIVTTAAQILSNAALEGNYHSNNIEELASTLLIFNEEISDRIIFKVTDEVCLNMTIDNAVRTLFSKERVSQSIMVLWWIYYKPLYTARVDPMLMADYLRTLQRMPAYTNLPIERRDKASNLVSELPLTIRNLYFSDRVCIRNVRHAEYLSSPHWTQWDGQSRYVFTTPKKYTEEHWTSKKREQERVFEFVSQYNTKEYLYVPNMERFSEQYRYVMTFVPGGSVEKKSEWQIIAYNGNFLIKNLHLNEFLCTREDGLTYMPRKRYVFTEIEEHVHAGCEWTFESC